MSPNYIALAIPFFFLFIGVEWAVARALGRKVYRFTDAISDLGCGIGQQVTGIFHKGALLAIYIACYQYWRVADWEMGDWRTWALAAVWVDFAYYWWHRLSHEVNALWAAHIVHHQSEDFNLAVALRQAFFTTATSFPFYLPLAFFGVPPAVYLTSVSLSTLYQFWIHTELIGKLGPLEWVLNTPSHHRVHHGRNPQYIDRNHGAILILWDRLFGTFEEEREPVVYGVTDPFRSFDGVWANFHYWRDLWVLSRKAARWRDKLLVWVMPPGWKPKELGGRSAVPEVSRATYRKFDFRAPSCLRRYIFFQFVVVTTGAFTALLVEGRTSLAALAVPGALMLWAVAAWGALFEGKAKAFAFERARLAGVAAYGLAAAGMLGVGPFPIALLGLAVVSWVWLSRVERVAPAPEAIEVLGA